jgi:hypothetical protein
MVEKEFSAASALTVAIEAVMQGLIGKSGQMPWIARQEPSRTSAYPGRVQLILIEEGINLFRVQPRKNILITSFAFVFE